MAKTRGRPKKPDNEQAVRRQLLQAAADCLTEKSYRSVSIREIAQRAGSNSAMISYYFSGKEGLVAALLEETLGNVLEQPGSSVEEEENATNREDDIRDLLGNFIAINRENPWLIRLVMDDMVNQDSSLRKIMLNTIASGSARVIPDFIRSQQAKGLFKKDLDVKLTTVSLLSLFAFPFLANSILKDAYHIDMENVDSEQWIDHVVSLYGQS